MKTSEIAELVKKAKQGWFAVYDRSSIITFAQVEVDDPTADDDEIDNIWIRTFNLNGDVNEYASSYDAVDFRRTKLGFSLKADGTKFVPVEK